MFNKKVILIYDAIYSDYETSKAKIAEILNVNSIKTVENNIKNIEDIIYDIKLKQYRFKNILPKYITINALNNIINKSIVNKLLKDDFKLIANKVISADEMIETSNLSNLSKKLIILSNAIKYNCVLKVEYKGLNKPLQRKYIEPNAYFTNGFTYYAYITYNKKNIDGIGEERTFALNSIGKIEEEEYISNVNFKKSDIGNAYGRFKKDKYVLLNIKDEAARFFKRELIFNNDAFELIDEELDGISISVKMYYNHINEITKLIKQWMPKITIFGNVELKSKVYLKIEEDFKKLVKS